MQTNHLSIHCVTQSRHPGHTFQDVATRRAAAEGVLSKAEQLLHLPQMVWSGASDLGICHDLPQKLGEFMTKHGNFTGKHWMSLDVTH